MKTSTSVFFLLLTAASASYVQTYKMVGGNPLHTSNVPIAPGTQHASICNDRAYAFSCY